jgi:hypothetical protein
MSDWLDKREEGAGKRFLKNKVGFATDICKRFKESDLDYRDLRQKIDTVCTQILKWNGIVLK